jgi:AAA ATPase domain
MIGMRSAVVGRERVLAELGELLDAAPAGTGSVVLLTGEGGIGKSTGDCCIRRTPPAPGHFWS